ncbi:MAG: ribosomal protein S18-alanine N-acetyltransferase [Clostridia bacterium]|nr:ribosomal protein S18-alanine N-acetyltransferase [Clostridia bacterium]
MDNILISKMQDEDIEEALLTEQSHNIHILSKNILKEDIKNKNYNYLVAKNNDGKIIGYIGISYVLDSADIISIVVHKDYTQKGIATLLLQEIFAFAKENNIQKIMLEVRRSNLPAQKLYEKHGFKQIAIRNNYYDNTEDALIYEKEL